LNKLYGILYKENNKNNKLKLLEYSNDKNLGSIDFIAHHLFQESIKKHIFQKSSTVIVESLSFLGDSLIDILKSIELLILDDISILIIDDDIEITPLTCKSKKFISSLIKCEERLHQKRLEKRRKKFSKDGIKVGRKRGVLVKSKFDAHKEKIQELYSLGLSMNKIVQNIGVGTQQSLYHYIKTRGIKK
jgi:DNA invertase Pin-like site-specific DNA recombinase